MQKITWYTTISDVREKAFTVGGKIGSDGRSELVTESGGWWIMMENISLYVGNDEPAFKKGDAVKLSIEHMPCDSHEEKK